MDNPASPEQPPSTAGTLPCAEVAALNPHCSQLVCPQIAGIQGPRVAVVPLGQLPWRLTAESPQVPYVERPDDQRSPLHFGQLKLLLSMLTFLGWHTSPEAEYDLFYAGAAPGNSAAFVAGLFPNVTFYLFDPAEFCEELAHPPANVRVFNDFFTDETAAAIAARFAGRRTLFVSDIRTGKDARCVAADMAAQAAWARTVAAEATMLKFRLPWTPGRTEYFDGHLALQAFAPLTSTETRLISTRDQLRAGAPLRSYCHETYERQMAYHNMLGRVRYHEHPVQLEGLDHCYDCAVLALVGMELLRRETGACSASAAARWVARAVAALRAGRTLATEHSVSSTRRRRGHPERERERERARDEGAGLSGGPR